MASLRDTVKQYQEELRDGIAWVVFWREGRSWNGEDFYLDAGDSLTAEQKSHIQKPDSRSLDHSSCMVDIFIRILFLF